MNGTTHGERFDASKSKKISDAGLMALHDALTKLNAPKPGTFSALSDNERRTYNRVAKVKSRQKERDARLEGKIKATKPNVRTALSDAALMILATNGPGAAEIRKVLASIFAARPGVPLNIERRARSGKLRPLLAGVAR